MTTFTDQGIRAAAHESAHAAAAILLGLSVDLASIDRDKVEGWGAVHTSFYESDSRTVLEKAEARAVLTLVAVLWEPGADIRSSDKDVERAYKMAEIAKAEDPQAWVMARSRRAAEIIRSAEFHLLSDAISLALLEEGTLDKERVLELMEEAGIT